MTPPLLHFDTESYFLYLSNSEVHNLRKETLRQQYELVCIFPLLDPIISTLGFRDCFFFPLKLICNLMVVLIP